MKQTILICYLVAVMTNLALLPGCEAPENTIPDKQESLSTAEQTEPTVHTFGTEPTADTEASSQSGADIVETEPPASPLYSEQELSALDNTLIAYGPGRSSGGVVPGGALSAQKQYGTYGAHFLMQNPGNVVLTFDCGYEYNRLTADILDTLKEKNVQAVFFITKYYCETNPDLVNRILDEGHILGNHSANHKSMPTLSTEEMEKEILELHDYVHKHFDGYEMTLFRPPKGEYSVQSLALTQNLGYQSMLWSFAYRDWLTDDQPAEETALSLILSSLHSGGILLLHAVSATNAAILPKLIDSIHAMGYTIVLPEY